MNRLTMTWLACLAVLLAPASAAAQFETPSRAFHQGTAFPLDGKHLTVACESCHVDRVYKGTPTTCASCHWVRRQDDVYKTRLGMQCEQCHRTTTWSATKWDHAAATGMPLNAAHRTVSCDGCHKNAQFSGNATQCINCHQRDFDATLSPNHKAAGFPTACESCHRPSDATFTGVRFDHNATFPLVGTHAVQPCASCHVGQKYAGTPRDCVGCHRQNYERTTAPSHVAAGFSTACETCHQPAASSWGTGTFNHTAVFPLVGRHNSPNCTICHVNGTYRGTPRDCIGCHRQNYERTMSPSHVAAGFGTACETCHQPAAPSWVGGSFNHAAVFPLAGQHAGVACATCHVGGRFAGTPRTCVGCHRPAYEATRNPNHLAAGFPTNCETCHRDTDSTWTQGRFTHSWFPITSGPHRNNQCSACHTDPANYAVFTCLTCHTRTVTDSHHREQAGYRYESTACYACHPNGRSGGVPILSSHILRGSQR